MQSFKEYSEPTSQLVDDLPWALLEAPGVVRLKSGGLMRCLKYRGHDSESLTDVERIVIAAMANSTLMQLGQGWSLFTEVRRTLGKSYPYTKLPPGAAQIVEDVRRERFGAQGVLFHTEYVLTLVWNPSTPRSKKLVGHLVRRLFGGFFEGGEEEKEEQDAEQQRRQEELDSFLRTTRDLASALSVACASLHFMGDEEVLSWLHGAISVHEHPITPPSIPMYIDAMLADTPVQCGLEMLLGKEHVRVISIKGYPDRSHPKLLDTIERYPMPMRLCSRFICLTREESIAAIDTYQRQLKMQAKRLNPAIKEGSAEEYDSWILEQAAEAGMGLDAARRGEVHFGHHSLCVVIRHADYKTCQRHAEALTSQIRACGFACTEETANVREAWLSSLPGHVWANPRRAIISSQNMAHLLCTQATWQGSIENTHLGGAPHIVCRTDEHEPFYLNLNVNDVGHTMMLGPTGGGKSTLISSFMLQWMKYDNAQTFVFDKGRSSRATTLALGGQFLELSVEHPQITFQPLGRVNEPREFEFALTWLEEVASLEGLEIGADERDALRQALGSLKTAPASLRTMTSLMLALQHPGLRKAFSPYIHGGTHGSGVYAALWDNTEEKLGLSSCTTFEMEQLMDTNPRLIAMTLRYLFHRVEERLTVGGDPTLLILDEAWIFLSHPMFAARIREWLKVLRKKRTYVVFATQDMNDALSSPIASTLLQNCPTQILLANPKAMDETIYTSYRKLGLSRGQIQAISRLQNHGDRAYYLSNSLGSRTFHLTLSELELALASNSSEAHARMDFALRREAQTGMPYLKHYLELCGFREQAERFAHAHRLHTLSQGGR